MRLLRSFQSIVFFYESSFFDYSISLMQKQKQIKSHMNCGINKQHWQSKLSLVQCVDKGTHSTRSSFHFVVAAESSSRGGILCFFFLFVFAILSFEMEIQDECVDSMHFPFEKTTNKQMYGCMDICIYISMPELKRKWEFTAKEREKRFKLTQTYAKKKGTRSSKAN